ncbi:MAG: PorT family protein [Candidatus Azobacteroides sp.]|nr:PorT family protein [Candidatus Azobacteroides sp.]
MNFRRGIGIFAIFSLVCIQLVSPQESEAGLDLSFIAGVNIGATTPVPIPGDLKITKYNPKFNPKLGANLAYFFNENWGIGTGLTVDWKGMNVHTKVTDVHLSIDVPNLDTLTGYVTGRNTTQVNTFYLTQPIYGIYRFNPKWRVKTGIYIAEALSTKFKGDVKNVDIIVETPVSQEREVPYATLDYSDDVHTFDLGLLVGGEFRMNNHVGFYADFTWGFIPYFSGKVPIHFTMRNIYPSIGITYRIN